MKTHSTITALLLAFVLLLAPGAPARAQGNAQEAADMLRALNIQIGEAKLDGNRERVALLQSRYLDIQKKWGVRPSAGPRRPEPEPVRVPISAPWADSKRGSGKITGYQGGKITVARASVTLPGFWDEDHHPNQGGRSASLKFTDIEGNVYNYTGGWTWRGNLSCSLRVGDGQGGVYTGTLTMDREGISTISLIGQGSAEGYNVSFSH